MGSSARRLFNDAARMRLGDVLVRLQDTTAEIGVRAAVVLLIAFTVLAERFGS